MKARAAAGAPSVAAASAVARATRAKARCVALVGDGAVRRLVRNDCRDAIRKPCGRLERHDAPEAVPDEEGASRPFRVEQRDEVGKVLVHRDRARRVEATLAAPRAVRGDEAESRVLGEGSDQRRELTPRRERRMEHHDERRQAVAEIGAAELPGRGPRQRLEADERRRHLVRCQPLAAPGAKGMFAGIGGSRAEDVPGDGDGAPRRVGPPDDACLGHRRVRREDRLDLGREDVLAARDDEVGAAVGDVEAPLRVKPAEVARPQPAVRRERSRGLGLPAEVAAEGGGGEHLDLPDPVGSRIGDPDRHAGQRAPGRARRSGGLARSAGR